MAILNRRYIETWYRGFSSTLMRWLIDGALATNPSLQVSGDVNIPLSGLDREVLPTHFKADQEFVRNAIRYWAQYSIIMLDGISSWGNEWMKSVSKLPPPAKIEWDKWDLMFSAFLEDAYEAYWNEEFSEGISSESLKDFWVALWLFYGTTRGINLEDTLGELTEVINRVASRDHFVLSVMNQIPNVLEEMCNTIGLSWYGVPQPAWTTSFSTPRIMRVTVPDQMPDWDIPLIVLARVTGKELTIERILKHLKQHRDALTQLLCLHLNTLSNGTDEATEFWFPLENHRLAAGSEVKMGPSSGVLGVSESLATLLTKAGGIGPRPPVNEGDAFIVVSVSSIGDKSALDQALTEVGRIQNILRIADAGFRWQTSFYYFVAVQLKIPTHDDHHLYVAERLDNKQLYSDLTSEWLCQVRDWVLKVEQNNKKLGRALSVALKWQGLSRSQNGYEGKFLALWIALERLGGGSYEYKNVIPHIAGTLWRWNMWQGLNKADQIQCVYLDRERMSNLVHDLAKMRSEGVVHRGEFSSKVDVRFATMFLEQIVNDLLLYMLNIAATHEEVSTHFELMDYIDKIVGLQ